MVDLEAGPNTPGSLTATERNEHQAIDRAHLPERSFRSLMHRTRKQITENVPWPFKKIIKSRSRDPNNSIELAAGVAVEEQAEESSDEPTVVGAQEETPSTASVPVLHNPENVEVPPLAHGSVHDRNSQTSVHEPFETGSPTSDYMRKIKLVTEDEMAAENERRRAIRETWRNAKPRDYIEDSWEALWKEKPEEGGGLFQWPCDDKERKTLQLELIDALNSAPIDDSEDWVQRGLRAMSCWISLIGLRLNDLYLNQDYPDSEHSEIETESPVTQMKILIECIWVCNKHPGSAKIGDVLESCYRRQVLQQPSFDEASQASYAMSVLRYHIRAVRMSVYLVNILYKHEFPNLNKSEDLDSAWSLPISEAEIQMRPEQRNIEIDVGKQPFLDVGDLNVKDLQTIGRLRILWTPYWDEHLELETKWSVNVLKLYWFDSNLSQYLYSKSVNLFYHISHVRIIADITTSSGLCGGVEGIDRLYTTEEIDTTMSLLITSSRKEIVYKEQYEELEAPRWLSLLAHPKQKTYTPEDEDDGFRAPMVEPPLSKFRLPGEKVGDFDGFCWETKDQTLIKWSNSGRKLPHDRITISQFPYFHERLRELRFYMDSQQPKTLLGLWRDRRNSNSYWTFWFVVFFGFSSIGLAFGGLVVGTVGTWAQVKSLYH